MSMNSDAGRRRMMLASAAAGLAAAGLPLPAAAQAFPVPGRPIRIVVPFPPSAFDATLRMMFDSVSAELGTHLIVENRPGASTIIAAQEVQRAAPDGHTLFFTVVVTHTQNPHLFSKLPYDPFRDFTPVTQLIRSATVLTAHPSAPFNTIPEMVAYASANPRKIVYGSYGLGTTSHLNGENLARSAGIELIHAPYKGTAEALQDLLGGHISMMFDGTATAVANIRAGKVKGLGTATERRIPVLQSLPTIAEQGVPGIDIVGWQGLFGPANMNPAVVERIAAAFTRAVRSKAITANVEEFGNEVSGTTPAEFAKIVRSDHERWGKVIKAIGLKLD
jgi:tripartite-type tricarboxylate transporter receptor subunit TctC